MLTQAQSLPQYLLTLAQQHRTGELVIGAKTTEPWKLYFYSGRLIYATGGPHPVRRWYRSLRRHSEQFSSSWFAAMRTPDDYWEVDFINQAVRCEHISLNQAKAAIQSIVDEVILTLLTSPADDVQWHPNRMVAQQMVFLSVQRALVRSQKNHDQWPKKLNDPLTTVAPHDLPYLSPVVINPRGLQVHLTAARYKRLSRWMQGNITLWDMAAQTQHSLPDVIKLLLPLIYQGWVDLQPVQDIPAPYVPPRSLATQGLTKGLIACIDDSPLVSKVMAELVQPLGYEVLPVTKPVEQISILTQHRPDLIFLDITMPNISGYELCKFLRRTEAFYKTPIIILTGRDGMIDRMRAKMVGADDFLAKPPAPEKVAQLLDKYISDAR
ncbi:response regulator [Leptolyngbyaceae cyanobacterium CCMR0082]|uniref:Response regulator n=2 Tax=Adonisia turfae TaxID=2950184 RepID=A0A6M0S002_9CYAN|nr:response regulator [Adonisia turfae]MDV3352123.1 response regulator [Leptothoe sp. LEGE 181152]NEZ58523.1 response regulator [Adonisia turfae CCMR0081]NEZ61716.1 response regulator [Adonisia turfae CCMR0082]